MQNLYLPVALRLFEPLLGSTSGNPNIQSEFVQKSLEDPLKRKEELAAIRSQTPEGPTPEEVKDAVEKTSTIFFNDEHGLFLFDYQIRGFIKEAVRALIQLGDITGTSLWAYKKNCDSFIFVLPRRIYLLRPDVVIEKLPNKGLWEEAQKITKWEKDRLIDRATVEDKIFADSCYQRPADPKDAIEGVGALERPLRGETRQGERIALARSEKIEEGAQLALTILLLTPSAKAEREENEAEDEDGKKKKRKVTAAFSMDDIRNCLDYGSRKGLLQWRGGGFGRISWRELT